MELYHIGLQHAETHMRKQFEDTEEPQPERPDTRQERATVTERARLAIGTAFYRLATVIDPATPVPSRQH